MKKIRDKKIKGFTLIELLAVIVILAIIALIVTPIILNLIESSRDKSNINSTYGIVDAADLYFTNNVMDGSVSYDSDLLNILKFEGKKPDSGYVYINKDGNVSVGALFDDKCYIKDFNSNEVSKVDDVTFCDRKETLKDKLDSLPLKEVNVNGEVVNKVYGDKASRLTMKNYVWYSGNLWQVLEVNENDIKLVTSMPITSISYGNTSDYKTSWVKNGLRINSIIHLIISNFF